MKKDVKVVKEIRLDVENCNHVIGPHLEPIASVKPGEVVAIYTHDAFCNKLDSVDKKPVEVTDLPCPQTGPIYIEGAEPGDTLKVDIIDIERVRDWAVSTYRQGLGALVTTSTTRLLHDPIPEQTFIYRYNEEDGYYHYNDKLKFPWDPFVGTMGTAHGVQTFMSVVPFENGGNMDVPDVKPGNSVYLPVSVEGANFSIGDCHANQGQGEICGTALEIAGKVTLRFELIKGKSISWPRIESEDEIICVGAARPMEDAARIALCELIDWLVELGWDRMEAYQAVSQSNKLYVGSMVNPNYVMVAKIAKEIAYRK